MSAVDFKKSTHDLIAQDPRFRCLVEEFGYPDYTSNDNYFEALVKNIIYQQLSGKAARTIYFRFMGLFPDGEFPTASTIAGILPKTLTGVGLSKQKAAYVLDLSQKVNDGILNLDTIGALSDDGVCRELIQVKGIGQWTANMFLMFSLNRENVFPVGDLGVKKGVAVFEGLTALPSEKELLTLSKKWHPYGSIAAWYMWKIVDGPCEW